MTLSASLSFPLTWMKIDPSLGEMKRRRKTPTRHFPAQILSFDMNDVKKQFARI